MEDANGGATDRGPAVQMNSAPLKMFLPAVLPGVEQLRDEAGVGIKARQVRPFVEVAVNAGERQVVGIIRASVKSREDVFNVEQGQRRVLLVEWAIFASVPRPIPNVLSRLRVHDSSGSTSTPPSCQLRPSVLPGSFHRFSDFNRWPHLGVDRHPDL